MPSLRSERSVLHTVSASPFSSDALARALALMTPGDSLLLVGDATLSALRSTAAHAARLPVGRCFALAADLAARGYSSEDLIEGAQAIEDGRWVELVVACDSGVNWSR